MAGDVWWLGKHLGGRVGSRHSRQRSGKAVVAAAVVLAGAGGSAVGLGAPAWLAGVVGAVSALVAAVVVDRVFHARDERAAARERRSEALDILTVAAPGDEKDELGLLRADRSPVPFRGRERELRRLADWYADDSANPVFMITGLAGGKVPARAQICLWSPGGMGERLATRWGRPDSR
jgi:hypothetical protein